MTLARNAAAGAMSVLPVMASAADASPNPLAGIGTTLVSLAIVVGVLFALAWVARRAGRAVQLRPALLKTVATLSVGARERVLIVEAGDQWLVIGATANSINTLCTMPKGETPANAPIQAPAFAAILGQLRGKRDAQ